MTNIGFSLNIKLDNTDEKALEWILEKRGVTIQQYLKEEAQEYVEFLIHQIVQRWKTASLPSIINPPERWTKEDH